MVELKLLRSFMVELMLLRSFMVEFMLLRSLPLLFLTTCRFRCEIMYIMKNSLA